MCWLADELTTWITTDKSLKLIFSFKLQQANYARMFCCPVMKQHFVFIYFLACFCYYFYWRLLFLSVQGSLNCWVPFTEKIRLATKNDILNWCRGRRHVVVKSRNHALRCYHIGKLKYLLIYSQVVLWKTNEQTIINIFLWQQKCLK